MPISMATSAAQRQANLKYSRPFFMATPRNAVSGTTSKATNDSGVEHYLGSRAWGNARSRQGVVNSFTLARRSTRPQCPLWVISRRHRLTSPMSAIGCEADVELRPQECPLLAHSGRSGAPTIPPLARGTIFCPSWELQGLSFARCIGEHSRCQSRPILGS